MLHTPKTHRNLSLKRAIALFSAGMALACVWPTQAQVLVFKGKCVSVTVGGGEKAKQRYKLFLVVDTQHTDEATGNTKMHEVLFVKRRGQLEEVVQTSLHDELTFARREGVPANNGNIHTVSTLLEVTDAAGGEAEMVYWRGKRKNNVFLYRDGDGEKVRADVARRMKGFGLEREVDEAETVFTTRRSYTFRLHRNLTRKANTVFDETDFATAVDMVVDKVIGGPPGP